MSEHGYAVVCCLEKKIQKLQHMKCTHGCMTA